MYWPTDTWLASNVAREAKRVAHPWTKGFIRFGQPNSTYNSKNSDQLLISNKTD